MTDQAATAPDLAGPRPRPVGRHRAARPRPVAPRQLEAGLRCSACWSLTAALYLWGLGASGWANSFYSAAVLAGTKSWKAFLFGSFDASNFITVDKPPASLWVMDLSARLFGVNAWSILVPQALEGVAAVGILYATVRRRFGHAAGLIAGAVLALTPVAVLMFRYDNPDSLLVLLLVGSAYALTRALEGGRTRWLLLAGVLVGFGFLTKMLGAFLVLPGFAAVYLLAAPVGVRRRIVQLLAAGLAVLVSAGWWVALVTLWPAADRPYIGGSTGNSELNLIFGYNGFGRLTGNETGSVGGGGGWGPTGPAPDVQRHLRRPGELADPGGADPRRGPHLVARPRPADRRQACRRAAVGQLAGHHRRWSSASPRGSSTRTTRSPWLRPSVRWSGMGGVELWRQRHRLAVARRARRRPGRHRRLGVRAARRGARTGCPGWGPPSWSPASPPRSRCWRLRSGGAGSPWRWPAACWRPRSPGPPPTPSTPRPPRTRGAIPSAGPAVADASGGPGGGAGIAGAPGAGPPRGRRPADPAARRDIRREPGADRWEHRHDSGRWPGRRLRRGRRAVRLRRRSSAGRFRRHRHHPAPGTVPNRSGGTLPGGSRPGRGARLQRPGRHPRRRGDGRRGTAQLQHPVDGAGRLLEKDAGGYSWVAATVGANDAAGYQLATGDPVMAIGGFNGTDPWPTLAVFEKLVGEHRIHYFIAAGSGGGAGVGGSAESSAITSWVESHFSTTTVGGTTLYDLTRPASSPS